MKYYLGKILVSILLCAGIFLWIPTIAVGFSGIRVNVEVIKASRNLTEVDPYLKDLVKELTSILNYSSFSLLKKIEIRLDPEEKEGIMLSPDRKLEIKFLGFGNKHARLLAKILEKGQESFRTTLFMINKGNVLIGGPPHQDGVLLLRIGTAFEP